MVPTAGEVDRLREREHSSPLEVREGLVTGERQEPGLRSAVHPLRLHPPPGTPPAFGDHLKEGLHAVIRRGVWPEVVRFPHHARVAAPQLAAQPQIATECIEHVLPGPGCFGMPNDHCIALGPGTHAVWHETVLCPVATPDHVARPSGRDGRPVLPAVEKRAHVGIGNQLRARLRPAVGIFSAQRVVLPVAPGPFDVAVALIASDDDADAHAGAGQEPWTPGEPVTSTRRPAYTFETISDGSSGRCTVFAGTVLQEPCTATRH